MAVKCSIIELAIERLNNIVFGLGNVSNNNAIIENYVESLGCDVAENNCLALDSACALSMASIVNCNISVIGITTSLDSIDNTIIIFTVGTIYGAKAPISYSWFYDVNTFDLADSNGTNLSSVRLRLKPGKTYANVITPITINITDTNGCASTKACYFVGGTMQCNLNYQPCKAPSGLTVVSINDICNLPKTLTVQ